jgi:hybrid cluster-associated redox disulfide protein
MKITKDMNIQEVVNQYPQLVPVFFRYGLGCLGCAAARFESIEQGAMAHGIDVPALIADLNKALAE